MPLAALHAEFEGDRTAPRIWAGPSVCGDAFKGLGLERLLLRLGVVQAIGWDRWLRPEEAEVRSVQLLNELDVEEQICLSC